MVFSLAGRKVEYLRAGQKPSIWRFWNSTEHTIGAHELNERMKGLMPVNIFRYNIVTDNIEQHMFSDSNLFTLLS